MASGERGRVTGASVSACLGRKVCVKTSHLHCTCHAHPADAAQAETEVCDVVDSEN